MVKEMYITFDPYYNTEAYNSFLTAAKNNGIEYEEYIRIRQPYYRFLKIKDKSDLPSFVNYDFANSSDKQFLVSTIKPQYPNEALFLKPKPGQEALYYEYITPKPLRNLNKKKYIMVFKARSFSELSSYSKKLGDSKIYYWGKSETKGYKIYYTFNPYMKGIISPERVLMEFGTDASLGIKHDKSMPRIKGELEYMLNYYVLVKEKLENKTLEAEYWENGNIHPLKRTTFL
jgi:hypothetical protein